MPSAAVLSTLHQMLACITSPSLFSESHPSAGAIWELHELVRKARGDRRNCEQLDLFCQDVMRVLNIAGAHLSDIDGLHLAKLLEHVEAGIELVDACSRSGALGSRLNICHSCGLPLALRVGGRLQPPRCAGQRAEHVPQLGCPWPCESMDADGRMALQAAGWVWVAAEG